MTYPDENVTHFAETGYHILIEVSVKRLDNPTRQAIKVWNLYAAPLSNSVCH
jgi:hypothetical protein